MVPDEPLNLRPRLSEEEKPKQGLCNRSLFPLYLVSGGFFWAVEAAGRDLRLNNTEPEGDISTQAA